MEKTNKQWMNASLNALRLELPESIAQDVADKVYAYVRELEDKLIPMENLTALQEELGYVKGPISTVAVLGLVGESGEVLGETHCSIFNPASHVLDYAITACESIDELKKQIRKGKHQMEIELTPENEAKFDAELSDTFYYLKALAANRGLSISDLARMGHDKVRAKQAAGGSSEDRRDK